MTSLRPQGDLMSKMSANRARFTKQAKAKAGKVGRAAASKANPKKK